MAVFFRNKRIAELIRKGLTMNVSETTRYWIAQGAKNTFSACALGMAIVGKIGTRNAYFVFYERLRDNNGNAIKTISDLLHIEPLMVEEIYKLHSDGLPAIEIAECLEFEDGDDQLDLHHLPI